MQPEISAVSFAEKVKRWRGKRNMKEAASDLGIPYETYAKYESGTRKPHKSYCLCCLETRMLLTGPTIPAAPVPLHQIFTGSHLSVARRTSPSAR